MLAGYLYSEGSTGYTYLHLNTLLLSLSIFRNRSSGKNAVNLQKNIPKCEIAPRYVCSPINFLHTFRTPFSKNTYRGLLLYVIEINLLPTFLSYLCIQLGYQLVGSLITINQR